MNLIISHNTKTMNEGKRIESKIIRVVKNYIGKRIDEEKKYPKKILLNPESYKKYSNFKKADILALKRKGTELRIPISKNEDQTEDIKLVQY